MTRARIATNTSSAARSPEKARPERVSTPTPSDLESFFAPCPRGLEGVLADELATLDAQFIEPRQGGVAFAGPYALLYRVNVWSRVASRVLLRLAHGRYRSEQDVHALARTVAWPTLFDVSRTLRVDTVGTRSPVKSLNFVTLTVKDAVCDVFREAVEARPSVNKDSDIRISVHLDAAFATIYLDTSGEPLFMRGYRKETGDAPLRENLAAGILLLSGWQPGQVLYDPMCGSGTLLIEAALMQRGIAPGARRNFGFEKLSRFNPDELKLAQATAPRTTAGAVLDVALREDPRPENLFGSDISGDMIVATQNNADAAGVGECMQLKQGNFIELRAPADAGVLIANPPYGERLSGARGREGAATAPGAWRKNRFDARSAGASNSLVERDNPRDLQSGGVVHVRTARAPAEPLDLEQGDPALAALYPKIGDHLKKTFAGWQTHWLTGDLRLGKLVGLKSSKKTVLFNGPIECRLFGIDVVAGSMRESEPS